MAINLDFLREVEGYRRIPYIPTGNDGKPIGQSGVTVGTGIDVGQMSMAEFDKLPLDAATKQALKPYVGKKGAEAQAALRLAPPTPLRDEVLRGLDSHMINESVDELRSQFPQFDSLTDEAQTVALSLRHNFGPSSLKFNTMNNLMDGNWQEAFTELTDANKWKNPELYKRRVKEANLLRSGGSYDPKSQQPQVQLPPQVESMLPPFMQQPQPQTVPFPAQLPSQPTQPNRAQRVAGAVLPDWLEQYLPAGLTGRPNIGEARSSLPAAVTPYRASQPYSFEQMVDYPGLSKRPERSVNELLQPIEVQAQRKTVNPLLSHPDIPAELFMQDGELTYEEAFPVPPPKTYSF